VPGKMGGVVGVEGVLTVPAPQPRRTSVAANAVQERV
jgi:hypothetical protein